MSYVKNRVLLDKLQKKGSKYKLILIINANNLVRIIEDN